MAANSGSTRWWENYLVRYFLPSLAGMVAVWSLWKQHVNDGKLDVLNGIFGTLNTAKDFGTPHLILWLLAGTLYCYIASYPILVFHVTRALDFSAKGKVRWLWFNPYLWTLGFTVFTYILVLLLGKIGVMIVVPIFVIYQIRRIIRCYQYTTPKHNSLVYAYLWKLSTRRGIVEVTENSNPSVINDGDPDRKSERVVTSNQKQDLLESIRHMREHGNTAFILLLEIAIYPIFSAMLDLRDQESWQLFAALGIWIFPSVLVHGLGQHLEHRFSMFKTKHKLGGH